MYIGQRIKVIKCLERDRKTPHSLYQGLIGKLGKITEINRLNNWDFAVILDERAGPYGFNKEEIQPLDSQLVFAFAE